MESPKIYTTTIDIVGQKSLSKERQAEAIAAKALLGPSDQRDKLLSDAARLAPKDPRYLYWIAQDKVKTTYGTGKSDYSAAKPFVEKALKADPTFLPAKYALAIMQPTADQRIAALQELASTDADNAQPYLLMAVEKWSAVSADKKMAEGSDNTAYDISIADWQQVSDLMEKFAAAGKFSWQTCAPPSAQDITVSTNGKAWPTAAIESTIYTNLYSLLPAQLGAGNLDPTLASSAAILRQFARQASWAANQAQKNGDTDKALSLLSVNRKFAAKYASHEPHRLVPILTAQVIRALTADQESKILEAKGDKDALKALNDDSARWKDAVATFDQATISKGIVTVDSVQVTSTQKLQYADHQAEETAAKTVLTKAGLIPDDSKQ